jgi:small-conductance mechanosensitive channel
MNSSGIDLNYIHELLQFDSVVTLLLISFGAWAGYKILLRKVSVERHRIFAAHFKDLTIHLSIGTLLFASYQGLTFAKSSVDWVSGLASVVGVLAICWGCIVFITAMRVIAYEYLFFRSMRAGVPALLVNILTLLLYMVALAWILKTVFHMQLIPIVATSAVLSIVLGLALQDTIGNLFAAVSLQIDKPFGLGDWIEVRTGTSADKIAGRVEEISWRATLMRSMTDELITIPNRTMAQAQISNFAARDFPFLRSLTFRIPHDASIAKAKQALLSGIENVAGVVRDPGPLVIVTDTTESWIALKLVYNVADYGSQFLVADRCIENAITSLRNEGIELAKSQLKIQNLTVQV